MKCIKRAHSLWTTCKCPDCAVARRRLSKMRNAGLYRRVASDEAWEVLAAKIDDHWTAAAIGSATGLSLDSFSRHVAAHRKGDKPIYLGPTAAAKILAMGWPTEGQIGATGTRRRLQALARIGYGLQRVADESGVQFSTLAMVRNRNERVHAKIAAAVRDVYDRLYMIPGPDVQAIRQATEKGWHGPLAWDDDEIDNPAAKPAAGTDHRRRDDIDEAVVERVLAGEQMPTTRAEKDEIVRRWKARGWPLAELERLLGIKAERYGKEEAA